MDNKSFEIVVRATLRDSSGKVLLVRRAKRPEKGKWSLPGGKVEFGEESGIAAVREIREELNIEFRPKFRFFKEDYKSVPGTHCLVLYFSGSYIGTIIPNQEEIEDYSFFSKEEIQYRSDIGFDHKDILLEHF